MDRSICRIMPGATLTVYAGVALLLGVSTFLSPMVYGSWWFVALWALFAGLLTASIAMTAMWRNGGSFLLHLSLLAMLGGGLMTWLTQERGAIRINPGERVEHAVSESGETFPLPSGIALERFEVEYYPGGLIPRDYVSHLVIDGEKRIVSMNNILEIDGYRLLQASYDSGGATVLSVNHDPYGIPLSYAGYVMFAIGGLWIMLSPGGRFRKIMKSLSVVAIILSWSGDAFAVNADVTKTAGVPRESADSLRSRQVIYNGRTVTFNTLARDVVTKLYGKPSYRGLTPEQILLSYRLFPEEWKDQPIIRVKEKMVCEALGIEGGYLALSDLFDQSGNYRVAPLYHTLPENGRRGVEDLDEKAGILLTLLSDDLIVAADPDSERLPEWRVDLELAYNAIPSGTIIFILLFSGFLISALSLVVAGRWSGMMGGISRILLLCALLWSAAVFMMQWILSSHLPLSNMYETLEFVVLVMEIMVIALARRNRLLLPLGMLFAGALALVAHLVEVNPVVTPLMPVLHSPWLSLHVSLVMTSYAILSFTSIISVTALLRRSKSGYLRNLSSGLLYPGVWLLGMGIFTGAVWANVSWGQYWSWDPKETWALVTMMVYALPLHGRFMRILRRDSAYHLYMLFAVMSIAMTYFGVNYLDSMHAYN